MNHINHTFVNMYLHVRVSVMVKPWSSYGQVFYETPLKITERHQTYNAQNRNITGFNEPHETRQNKIINTLTPALEGSNPSSSVP